MKLSLFPSFLNLLDYREIMLLALYITLFCWALIFLVLSTIRKETLLFAWIPVMLFFSLGITSFNIEENYCDLLNATENTWSCFTLHHNDTGMVYLNFGLGFLCLAYAIIISVMKPAETLAEQEKKAI